MLDAFANATLTGNVYLDAGMLAAAGFIGPIFPMVPASTEMLCTAFGLKGFSPMLAGLSCAFGQCSLYVLLFLFGERFFATRCKFLRRRVDTLAFKHRRLFERSSCAITAGAGAMAFPRSRLIRAIAEHAPGSDARDRLSVSVCAFFRGLRPRRRLRAVATRAFTAARSQHAADDLA